MKREGLPTLFRGGDDLLIAKFLDRRDLGQSGPRVQSCLPPARANPATIRQFQRCSSLQYQKMLPAPSLHYQEMLPAPYVGRTSFEDLEIIGKVDRQWMLLSLQLLKISLQIAKLQGDSPARPFRV
jgi:hypothetical protein